MDNRSSYPSHSYTDRDSRLDLDSMRNSSIESEFSKAQPVAPTHRKAYMDLRDAMALLDETCPNVEPSPSLTPRTPRTPHTPYLRNKRARSKSSDNSSIYSNDQLSNRSFETSKDRDKKRPFLKKIGISKTEDRPFLAKFTPRIIGKPYLEKIGPSKAVERPFLDKIGSSKTLDKFIFDTPRNARRNELKRETKNNVIKNNGMKSDVMHEIEQVTIKENVENDVQETITTEVQCAPSEKTQITSERRRSGKEFLLKMYSFETEDLESIVQTKEHRDQLRGTSLDDILDSGPSSLPTEDGDEQPSKLEVENRPVSVAELLKCRVTTSEEIVFSTTCLDSLGQTSSWSNSPRRKQRAKKRSTTPNRRRIIRGSTEVLRSDDSTPNSPTKRPISNVSPDRELVPRNNHLETLSPTKTRKSTVGDTLDRKLKIRDKYNQFERRGISSDNLLAKDAFSFVTAARTITDDTGRTREISSEDSLVARRDLQEYTKETFKQLQDKFKLQEVSMESYADFKRRTRGAQGIMSRQERVKTNLLSTESDAVPKITSDDIAVATDMQTNADQTAEVNKTRNREGTLRAVLKKQEGIDHSNNQESDTNSSIRRPKRRIFHEPSQETMDLLTELRKVKSLLKTPSWEKDLDLDQKPARMPKRILLTDKEFCLSVERENSIRRPSKAINSLETTKESNVTPSLESSVTNQKQEGKERRSNGEAETIATVPEQRASGLALFEKKCLSLDYVDEEKSQRTETRAISLASTRDLPSGTREIDDYPDAALTCDSKSYSSDVFNPSSEETDGKARNNDLKREPTGKPNQNHCAEVDIAIPIDQKITSHKGDIEIQGRTSDLYEILSPRSTPFRVKKRLGKISVEETVKPENFTLGSKVDCRSVTQKRTKCFPL